MASKPLYSFVDHRVAGWFYPWIMAHGQKPTSSPLEEKMRLVKELGYDGLGTSWWDLVCFYQERGDLTQLQGLSAELGQPLTGYTFVVDGWAFSGGEVRKNALVMGKASIDLARDAGCRTPSSVGPFDSGDLHNAAKVFRELAQYAGQFGLKLGLEFLGVSRQINSIKAAWEVLELADVSNSGVALDTYHFYAGPSTFADLEALPVSKIIAIHLADGPTDLSDPSIDLNREMPGEGELRLVDFVKVVDAKGFKGYWHVECIQGLDYASDMRTVGERGLRSMKSVVEQGLATESAPGAAD